MTALDLRAIQNYTRMSDRAFLEWLAIAATSTARRKLRRWKSGDLPVPDNIARKVRLTFGEECWRLGV